MENSPGRLFRERGRRFGRCRKRIAELIFIGESDRAHPAVYAPKPLDLARIRAPPLLRSVRYNQLTARLAICRKSSEGISSRRRFNPFLPHVKRFLAALRPSTHPRARVRVFFRRFIDGQVIFYLYRESTPEPSRNCAYVEKFIFDDESGSRRITKENFEREEALPDSYLTRARTRRNTCCSGQFCPCVVY